MLKTPKQKYSVNNITIQIAGLQYQLKNAQFYQQFLLKNDLPEKAACKHRRGKALSVPPH